MNSLKYIIIPFFIAILSQIVKTIIETIKYKKINISRLFDGMGGMPSTHSTLTSSLTTIIYLNYGVTSILFALSLFFSLLIIPLIPHILIPLLHISIPQKKKSKNHF